MNTSRIVEPRIDPKFYTSTPAPKLTPKAELFQLEHEIELHWEASAAKIKSIYDRELWRADDYTSWKDYCQRRWHKTRQSVYQLMDAAEVAKEVSAMVDTPVQIANEKQGRALKSVPPEHRAEVLKKASGNGHLTAKAITEAAEVVAPKPRTEAGKPKHLLAIWSEIEGLYGKALNRLDELNRTCRNPVLHVLMIETTKKLMDDLDEWRDGVKKA